jgi:hypothetical protein
MKNPLPTIQGLGRSREFQNWTLFCLFIFLLKLLLFALDPLPKFIMGDSGTYIWTALSGGIPEDRSFVYGYVLGWASTKAESLTPLLLLQLFLSGIVSILFASICRFIFQVPARWSYLLGFLCALDPLQLLYERYIMTEAISLFCYAIVLYRAFSYLKKRRLLDLILVQVVSLLLISFRMSYLPLVEINTILLPLIAFSGEIWRGLRHRPDKAGASRWSALGICGGHLLASVILMFGLHTGYKQLNGHLAHREPAYVYTTGVTILAFWSPALEPEDSADPRLAELIRNGDELALKDRHARNVQLFSPDHLIDRVYKLEPDRAKADQLARQTAFHALWRNPLAIARLAWETYADYWSVEVLKMSAEGDFSFYNPPSEDLVSLLASRFHLAHDRNSQVQSALQRYYVWTWPYYFVVLLAPLITGFLMIFRRGREYALLLFVHSSLMMTIAMIFGELSIRFLQPVSFMTLLAIALWVSQLPFAAKHNQKMAAV